MTHERSLTTRNLGEGQLVNGLALLLERTGFRWREQASRLPSKRQVQDSRPSEDARLSLLCNILPNTLGFLFVFFLRLALKEGSEDP